MGLDSAGLRVPHIPKWRVKFYVVSRPGKLSGLHCQQCPCASKWSANPRKRCRQAGPCACCCLCSQSCMRGCMTLHASKHCNYCLQVCQSRSQHFFVRHDVIGAEAQSPQGYTPASLCCTWPYKHYLLTLFQGGVLHFVLNALFAAYCKLCTHAQCKCLQMHNV